MTAAVNAEAVCLQWGAALALANDKPLVSGLSVSVALAVLTPATEAPALRATTLTRLGWNTTTGTGATQVRVYKNGVVQLTTLLTAVKGAMAISIDVASGDLISLDYSGTGPAPGASTWYLST
jgi:hypothetical protein